MTTSDDAWRPTVDRTTTVAPRPRPGRRPAGPSWSLRSESAGPPGPHQTRLVREHHHLRPVPRAQLRRGPQHVRLDGQRAEEEPLPDLVVGQTLRDEHEHLALPGREVR